VGDNREVEVELGRRGRGYLDKDCQRVTMGLGLFLDAFILGRIPSSSASLPTAYLAQSDLLEHPTLAPAVPTLEHFASGPQRAFYRRTLWIGPEGSFTPFHRDPYIGLYSQIVGRKKFHMLPPQAAAILELSIEAWHTNTSTIPFPVSQILNPGVQRIDDDIHALRLERYRSTLDRAFALHGACEVDVQAGESVLVPEGWWHSAEGVGGAGVGVGAWFR